MDVSIYVHVPFCLKRCAYCDFNTYANALHLRPAYVAALKKEVRLRAERYGGPHATTLYFGGGTPSLLPSPAIIGIVREIRHAFRIPEGAEVSLEANPGTLDEGTLKMLRVAGINRLSLGVQSAQDDLLALLGRVHDWQEAVAAVRAARRTGFTNVSLDLIFGLPTQTLAMWEETLERTLELAPEHLSVYGLSLEPGTPLAERVALGELPEPDPDLAAEMYEYASERLHRAGYWQYEISNWARGKQPAPEIWALPPNGRTEAIGPTICRHNLTYWRNRPWVGLGAGAYSWFHGRRWSNLPHPSGYIQSIWRGQLRGGDVETISPEMERAETMMMGLRLAEGVTGARFRKRFGLSLTECYGDRLAELSDLGLLSWDGQRARLSAQGRLLGNRVFGAFLS